MLILRPKRLRPLAALGCGVVLALGQAPFNFPYLGLLAVPVLLSMLQATLGMRGGFKLGWLAGLGYFGVSLSWIVEPFLVDIALHGWMAPFALILMAGGMALFWGLAFALSGRWMRGVFSDAVILAGFWTLAEVLRSTVFTGFPWALLAYGWVETPIIQAVSIVGVHGLGFLLVLVSGLLLWRTSTIVALVLAILVAGFGLIRLDQHVEMTAKTIRLVQPNAEQHLKWQPEFIPVFYQRLLDLSSPAPTPDAVIWPEVAIAYLPDEQPSLRADIANTVGAPVILGARRRDIANAYNSLFVIDASGNIAAQYDKHHLVPFGEYLPFENIAERLGISVLTEMFSPIGVGEGPVTLTINNLPPFLPLICYEAIFPDGLFPQDRPEWLVHVTNDAWFGKYNGPYQHLAQSKTRAIEQGLPMARAANTGVSAMIDPYGRVTASLPLGQAGYIDAVLPAPLAPTIFVRTGPWAAAIVIFVLLLIQLMAVTRRDKKPME